MGGGLCLNPHPLPAFPAKAGIQWMDYRSRIRVWVPAFAGKADGGLGYPLLRPRFGLAAWVNRSAVSFS